tara:strand:- start:240 stop:485 length:246 start_codon:yes stop_codon:yes gene_type:complete
LDNKDELKNIIMNVRLEIVKELSKFRERTSFYIKDYWGSEEQIQREIKIINQLNKISNLDIEMKHLETIVEWYERMLKITK